jgi:predicted HNH restriction endonuclease
MSVKSKKHFGPRRERRQLTKAKLVLEFGNKCFDCKSFDLPIASFTFHHINERMNSRTYISPSDVITSTNVKVISQEKKKWILLCSNCHNVRHTDCKLSATQLHSSQVR